MKENVNSLCVGLQEIPSAVSIQVNIPSRQPFSRKGFEKQFNALQAKVLCYQRLSICSASDITKNWPQLPLSLMEDTGAVSRHGL